MAIDVAKPGAAPPPALRGEARPSVRERAARESAPKASPLARLSEVKIFGSKGVSLEEMVLFTQQLALLIETGTGLVPSIEALSTQIGSPTLRKVLTRVREQLEEGMDFSECLREHPNVFDGLYVGLVRAGEASGALQESLMRIAGIMEVRKRMRARIQEAMTYPMVLSIIMTATMIFLLTYVVPRFASIFDALGDELPWSTKLILGVSGFLKTRWWLAVAAAIAGAFAGRSLWKTRAVRRLWDRMKISMPVLGGITGQAYIFQLFSSFGLLLKSRVPHLEAIGIAREVIKNVHYDEFFLNLTKHVEEGHGVALAFRETKFLPNTVKLMISTGETSGALDMVMTKLSEHYRVSLESGIRRLGVVLEQVMLIVMGVMVGFIAISFILPIMKMSQAVH